MILSIPDLRALRALDYILYVYMYTYIIQMPFPTPPGYLNEQSTYDNIMVANMVLEFEKE